MQTSSADPKDIDMKPEQPLLQALQRHEVKGLMKGQGSEGWMDWHCYKVDPNMIHLSCMPCMLHTTAHYKYNINKVKPSSVHDI